MSSINTNIAAITALQNLQTTNKNMMTVQSEISTGYKVASASDNAAYWSIATTMRSDKASLGAVNDSLGLGSSVVNTAYTAVNSAIDLVSQIKAKLVAAETPGVDRTKIQTEITQLQGNLKSIADSANFNGENWISVNSTTTGYNATKSIVSSFTRDSSGVSVGTINVDTTQTALFDENAGSVNGTGGLLDQTLTGAQSGATYSIAGPSNAIDVSTLTDSAADIQKLSDMISSTDTVMQSMTSAASDLGAVQSRISTQQSFISTLSGAIDSGVSSLVDADMNQASTQYQALQVKQQLGVQALSIANSQEQSILSLFRGG